MGLKNIKTGIRYQSFKKGYSKGWKDNPSAHYTRKRPRGRFRIQNPNAIKTTFKEYFLSRRKTINLFGTRFLVAKVDYK